jgi:ATP-dependent phosphoenolpyruvate carboxykinase
MTVERIRSGYGLENHGISNVSKVHWNHNTPMLYEEIIRRGEGNIIHMGPIAVRTGLHTGRAAKDKFIVKEPDTQAKVWWERSIARFPSSNLTCFSVAYRPIFRDGTFSCRTAMPDLIRNEVKAAGPKAPAMA